MKIGIVAIHPFNGSLGTMKVISETSKELSKRGIEVHVFTPFEKDHSRGNVFVHNVPSLGSQFGSGDRLYRMMRMFYASPIFARNLLLRKKTIEILVSSLAKSLLPLLKGINLNILQGEQEIPALACISLGKELKIPVVAHIRNFWPEECVDIGLIKRDNGTYRTLHQMIGEILIGADRVFTVSSYAKQFLENEYGICDKIVELPRGGRLLPVSVAYDRKRPSVVYSGSISRHENLPLFIRSMPLIKEKIEDSVFYITGKGDYVPKLRSLARDLSVNPHFLWISDRNEWQKFLSQCSVGVVPWANTLARRVGFPLKLLDYLSVGLPVVTTDVGGWTEIVEKEKLGLITEDNPESFADGIIRMLSNPELAEECGRRGLKLVKERYNWENTTRVLIREYMRLV